MKKQFHKSVLAVSVLGLVAGLTGNVLAATATGTATANVVRALTIDPTSVLAFGTFAASATGGIVNIDQATCDVDSDVPHFDGHGCGTFRVGGYNNAAYVVSYDTAHTLVHVDNPANTMPFSVALNGSPVKSLVEGVGNLQFGGSVTVSPSQPIGVYTGTYDVTVDYQ